MADTSLIRMSAREAVRRLKRREVSPLELIEAAAARIPEVEPAVNALPTLCLERAREHARRLMAGEGRAEPDHPGWLAGLPVAIKDLLDVQGVRTTYGSPIYADHVPAESHRLVQRIEARGGVVIAKSNTPEFGAGGNTFNEVFGKTRNPWNTSLTCGGSSGGAAVALATGEVWLAHGSDHGGSLRKPASYCSVVGLRPSPGVVTRGTSKNAFSPLSVQGPMARDVADTALFLDTMAGHDPFDPISIAAPATSYSAAVAAPVAPKRVAWTADLGGITPVDREVREVCAAAAARFAELGTAVEEASIDFSGSTEIFQTLRAMHFVTDRAPLLETHRDQLKPDIVWNTEKGLALTPAEIGRAERERAALCARAARFFEDYDLLCCPAQIIPPFDVDQRFVAEVDGHRFENYIAASAITFAITLIACPAICVPCGFTSDGRPIGLQIVGRPRGEAALLQASALLEGVLGLAGAVPIDPKPARVAAA